MTISFQIDDPVVILKSSWPGHEGSEAVVVAVDHELNQVDVVLVTGDSGVLTFNADRVGPLDDDPGYRDGLKDTNPKD